jgi:hypothetical protein
VVLAQIKALETQGALRQRRVWKTTLARLGYERNYPKRTILDLTALKRMPRLAAVAMGLDDFRRQLGKP